MAYGSRRTKVRFRGSPGVGFVTMSGSSLSCSSILRDRARVSGMGYWNEAWSTPENQERLTRH